MRIEQRLSDRGLRLPSTPTLPAGVVATFSWVRVVGERVLVSGHGAQDLTGAPAGPFGRVPDEVSPEQAMDSAEAAALSVLSSVKAVIDDLDRITAWVTVTGYVQAQPAYPRTTAIINAFSAVILDLFGDEVGAHARTAIGVAALPLNLPVVVAAELAVTPGSGR